MQTHQESGAWGMVGITTADGWEVIERISTPRNQRSEYEGSGGFFSVGYKVKKGEKLAFMKAMDFQALQETQNDPIKALNTLTAAHLFETKILKICSNNNMNRVVLALESGSLPNGKHLEDLVPYLVFELAEGDVRKRMRKIDERFRFAWSLRALHHTTVGLSQLHSRNVSHQDLKPSNILSFGETPNFKIADLGRCIQLGTDGPYDEYLFAGDSRYPPPEYYFGYEKSGWKDDRIGCDFYMLGSMLFFFVFGIGATEKLLDTIDPSLRNGISSGSWQGKYSEVLPTLQLAFTEILSELKKQLLILTSNAQISSDLVKVASEMCNPEYKLRGHPLEKRPSGNQFSLIRYISLFNRLAKLAEISARRKII